MRTKRQLTDEQIKYLIQNPTKPNGELAEMFGVKINLIGVYKSRARRLGLNIPKNSTGIRYKKAKNVSDIIKEVSGQE